MAQKRKVEAAEQLLESSGELVSLVGRRRELWTIGASAFAGIGVLFTSAAQGQLPAVLSWTAQTAVSFCTLTLCAVWAIIAFRELRLHGGMVLVGVVCYTIANRAGVAEDWELARAKKLNPRGVSLLLSLCNMLMAVAAGAVFMQTHHAPAWLIFLTAAGALVLWGRELGESRDWGLIRAERTLADVVPGTSISSEEWRRHCVASMHESNKDMLALVAYEGLVVFGVLQSVAVLGAAKSDKAFEVPLDQIATAAPALFSGAMVLISVVCCLAYVRLRLGACAFWNTIVPTDDPYRPSGLADSFLGYILLVCIGGIAVLVASGTFLADFSSIVHYGVMAAAVIGALVVERRAMSRARKKWEKRLADAAKADPAA